MILLREHVKKLDKTYVPQKFRTVDGSLAHRIRVIDSPLEYNDIYYRLCVYRVYSSSRGWRYFVEKVWLLAHFWKSNGSKIRRNVQ